MKLLVSNGRTLEVRNTGRVVFRLKAGPVPIKVNGSFLMEDDEAIAFLHQLTDLGLYTGGTIAKSKDDS